MLDNVLILIAIVLVIIYFGYELFSFLLHLVVLHLHYVECALQLRGFGSLCMQIHIGSFELGAQISKRISCYS
jgi:hypothetical protein